MPAFDQRCTHEGDGAVTVASDDQEFIVLMDIMYLDVRECGDYLLLGRKICALLELEVAYRTRQGKVAIDATKVDEAACSLNTGFLGWPGLAAFRVFAFDYSPSFCGL